MKSSLITPASGVVTFLDALKDQNLVPVEVTQHDCVQRITITHNVAIGQFEWRTEKIAEGAIGLLADVMADMWRYYFKAPLRPRLNSGHAKVCLDLDGDTLSMSFGLVDPAHPESPPIADPIVAMTMMSSGLFFLAEKLAGEDFNPTDALLGNIQKTARGGL